MLTGAGALRDAIEALLAAAPPAAATTPVVAVPPVVAVTDGWDDDLLADAAAGCASSGAAFLPVRVELGRALIGPAVLPGTPGCHTCAATRRAAADPSAAADRDALLRAHRERLARPSPWLTAFAVHAVATLAAAEVNALLAGTPPRSFRALMAVELATMAVEVHPFLPDPLCPACGDLPDDGPATATITLEPRRKLAPTALRATELSGRAERIRRTYVGGLAGVVSQVTDADACGLPVSFAPTGWPGAPRMETGIGRDADRAGSGLAAVLEAVERRAGTQPTGKRTVERASYADVAAHAIDPRSLGLFPPRLYQRPETRYRPFDPDRELDWVWAHSFRRNGPVLVPRSYAYYGRSPADRDQPLVYETSNGCALGTCLEEAALHGLLEVAERDAFLLTWYARMPAPAVAVGSASSPQPRLLAERIERSHGYRVLIFDSTVEQGIPAVIALAVHRGGDPSMPATLCAAAAHLDPERAAWSALGELALVVEHHSHEYAGKREEATALVADSDLVRTMEEHCLLYCHPDTLPRWGFLLDPGCAGQYRPLDFAEAFRDAPAPGPDLRADLLELVRRYLAGGLDVIVVDQTGPEQRAEGLVAVKVIVPGTLPMTFGHRNRRVHDLPRLHSVPVLLGHRARPLPVSEINPYPHPFP